MLSDLGPFRIKSKMIDISKRGNEMEESILRNNYFFLYQYHAAAGMVLNACGLSLLEQLDRFG